MQTVFTRFFISGLIIFGATMPFPVLPIGFYQNSYHARYSGMGGANLAVGGTPMDLATNPANLTLGKEARADFSFATVDLTFRYKDTFRDPDPYTAYNNNIEKKVNTILPALGFSMPISKKLYYGVALYIPGGAGIPLDGITRITPTGQSLNEWAGLNIPVIGESKQIKESYFSYLYFTKLTNGLAFDLGKLSIGIGLELVYGEQRTIVKYRDITNSFDIPGQGFYYQSNPNLAPGAIVGVTYRLGDYVKIAYSYQAGNNIYLDGKMTLNVDNPSYFRDAKVSYKFRLPERHNVGISWAKNGFTAAFDISYILWHEVGKLTQKLDTAWFPTPAGQTNVVSGNLDMKNDYAIFTGIEYKPDSNSYRTGYSFGRAPISQNGVMPLAGGILLEHIFMIGFGHDSGDYEFNFAFNYLFQNYERGTDTSDWDLQHAVFNLSNSGIRVLDFDHSVNIYTSAIVMNVMKKF